MSKSLIYVINPSTTQVLENGIIPLPIIARRRCRAIQSASDSIVLGAAGYYKINITITLTAVATGDAVVQVQKNGVAVQGLTGSTTISTAGSEINQIVINGIVRVGCNEGLCNLTLVNTGIEITTSNVSVDVEYLD